MTAGRTRFQDGGLSRPTTAFGPPQDLKRVREQTIAIAGCGVAGLASALLLTRDGHRVTLYERFDTPRPLGSGLMIQDTGLAVLRSLDLDGAALAAGARINRLFGKEARSGRTVLDVRYAALGGGDAFGIGIHRAALFDLLYRAVAAAGIAIETGRAVTGATRDADGRRRLEFAARDSAGPFDLVVDALGLNSPLVPAAGRALTYGALWASLDWPTDAAFAVDALEQRYVRASTMVGVLPIGIAPDTARPQTAFFWSLRKDQFDAWRTRGLAAWKDEVLSVWPATAPLLAQITSPEQLTFASYVHRTTRAPAAPGLIHIGDAWHATSPQLGQGANMALLDAFALAKALRETSAVAQALPHTVRLRHRHVRLYQAMSALFTPVYQSDSRLLPLLRDYIAGPLVKLWPATQILAAMVAGNYGDTLRIALKIRSNLGRLVRSRPGNG